MTEEWEKFQKTIQKEGDVSDRWLNNSIRLSWPQDRISLIHVHVHVPYNEMLTTSLVLHVVAAVHKVKSHYEHM